MPSRPEPVIRAQLPVVDVSDKWAEECLVSLSPDLQDDRQGRQLVDGTVSGVHVMPPKQAKKTPFPTKGSSGLVSRPHNILRIELPLVYSEDTGFVSERSCTVVSDTHVAFENGWRTSFLSSFVSAGKLSYWRSQSSLSYSVSSHNFRAGLALGSASPRLQLEGITSPMPKTSLGLLLETPFPTHPLQDDVGSVMESPASLHVSLKHSATSNLVVSSSARLDPLHIARNQVQLNLSFPSTIHSWNVGCGFNHRLQMPSFNLHISQQLWSGRFLHMQLQFVAGTGKRPMLLAFQLAMVQKSNDLKHATAIRLAQRNEGLLAGSVWTLGWTHGPTSIAVPIHIKSAPPVYWYYYPTHTVFFSLLSHVIQDVIAESFGWKRDESGGVVTSKTQSLTIPDKTRDDAHQQQEFMKKLAAKKMATEKENDGLVVLAAVYFSDEVELDVTVPLQFWVTNSCLHLRPGSKANMLGFCKVSTTSQKVDHQSVSWWRKFFVAEQAPKQIETTGSSSSAKLSIRYSFGSKKYNITLMDEDEAVLPTP